MFVHNLNPVLVQIGPVSIRYYGLVYALGLLFVTWFYLEAIKRKEIKHQTKDQAVDMMMYGMIWLVLGARIYHIITALPYYLESPIRMIEFWKGGMAFFGGFIGVLVFLYIYTKRHNLDFMKVGETILVPVPLVIAVGRIANFINAEHYGHVTDVWWAVKFPGTEGYRHPSQLYEMLTMLALFGIVYYLYRRDVRKGTIFASFMLFYGIFRFMTEFFRSSDEFILWFTYSQWLSMAFVIAGAALLFRIYGSKGKAKA